MLKVVVAMGGCLYIIIGLFSVFSQIVGGLPVNYGCSPRAWNWDIPLDTTNNITINDGSGLGYNYSNSVRCQWNIFNIASNALEMAVIINYFEAHESSNDWLIISDTSGEGTAQLKTFTGKILKEVVLATTGNFSFYWETDSHESAEGFMLTVYLRSPSGCTALQNGQVIGLWDIATITSKNLYSSRNLFCSWNYTLQLEETDPSISLAFTVRQFIGSDTDTLLVYTKDGLTQALEGTSNQLRKTHFSMDYFYVKWSTETPAIYPGFYGFFSVEYSKAWCQFNLCTGNRSCTIDPIGYGYYCGSCPAESNTVETDDFSCSPIYLCDEKSIGKWSVIYNPDYPSFLVFCEAKETAYLPLYNKDNNFAQQRGSTGSLLTSYYNQVYIKRAAGVKRELGHTYTYIPSFKIDTILSPAYNNTPSDGVTYQGNTVRNVNYGAVSGCFTNTTTAIAKMDFKGLPFSISLYDESNLDGTYFVTDIHGIVSDPRTLTLKNNLYSELTITPTSSNSECGIYKTLAIKLVMGNVSCIDECVSYCGGNLSHVLLCECDPDDDTKMYAGQCSFCYQDSGSCNPGHPCSQLCTCIPDDSKIFGWDYQCGCVDSYILKDDMHTCEDINECLTNPCTEIGYVCINEPGTYKCETLCNDGIIADNEICDTMSKDTKNCINCSSVVNGTLCPFPAQTCINETQFNEIFCVECNLNEFYKALATNNWLQIMILYSLDEPISFFQLLQNSSSSIEISFSNSTGCTKVQNFLESLSSSFTSTGLYDFTISPQYLNKHCKITMDELIKAPSFTVTRAIYWVIGVILFVVLLALFMFIIYRRYQQTQSYKGLPREMIAYHFYKNYADDKNKWTRANRHALKDVDRGSEEWEMVLELLTHFKHFSEFLEPKSIIAIVNFTLLHNFILQQRTLEIRFENSPQLFKKMDWKNKSEKLEESEFFNDAIQQYIQSYNWNKNLKVPIIPMVYCGPEKSYAFVCDHGFTEMDQDEKYGKGIYFTSSLRNSKEYTRILLAWLIPGNPFPLLDGSYANSSIISGYQSHYILLDQDNQPLPSNHFSSDHADLLVVGQENQVLPAFIISVATTTLVAM